MTMEISLVQSVVENFDIAGRFKTIFDCYSALADHSMYIKARIIESDLPSRIF